MEQETSSSPDCYLTADWLTEWDGMIINLSGFLNDPRCDWWWRWRAKWIENWTQIKQQWYDMSMIDCFGNNKDVYFIFYFTLIKLNCFVDGLWMLLAGEVINIIRIRSDSCRPLLLLWQPIALNCFTNPLAFWQPQKGDIERQTIKKGKRMQCHGCGRT